MNTSRRLLWALLISLIAGVACNRSPDDSPASLMGPRKVVLQTDWFPQPEHGGFYQALALGYYEEVGLDVTILSGGPNAMTVQQVLRGRADFALNRADTIYALVAEQNLPLVMVMATLQRDPQAILLHASNPISSLAELDGQRVMAVPGLTWIRWLEAKYSIRLHIIPHDFGMERFVNDPLFIQQCLLTNEPFFMRQQGIEVKVLPLRDSGFDPPHGIYTLQATIANDPHMVSRFVAASIRGWREFINGDPQPAFELIAAANPKMTPDFMRFSRDAIVQGNLVSGKFPDGTTVGLLDATRLAKMAAELQKLGLVRRDGEIDRDWFIDRFATESHSPGKEAAIKLQQPEKSD